jgi:hypothetical protein
MLSAISEFACYIICVYSVKDSHTPDPLPPQPPGRQEMGNLGSANSATYPPSVQKQLYYCRIVAEVHHVMD